jgi:hypothetical protein
MDVTEKTDADEGAVGGLGFLSSHVMLHSATGIRTAAAIGLVTGYLVIRSRRLSAL